MRKKRNLKKKEIIISTAVGLSKALLIAMAAGIIVAVPGGAQGVLEILNKIIDGKEEYSKKQLDNSLRYLKSKNLIDIQGSYQKQAYKLTKVGKRKASRLMNDFVIQKPVRWDGRIRLVIFDVPVKKKNLADQFRWKLKALGLAHVQKSILAHPYDCRDQVYYLAEKLKIKPYVRYIVAEDITGYHDLRARFDL